MNVDELVSLLQRFEVENNLYSDNLLSKVWKSIRTRLYYSLQKDLAVFSDVKPRKSLRSSAKATIQVIYNCLFNRPKISTHHKFLVVQHPRTKIHNKNRVDPYSYEFTRAIAKSSLFLSRTSLGEDGKMLSDSQASLDCLLVLKLLKLKPVAKNKFDSAERLMELLCESLSVDATKYKNLYTQAISDFLIEEAYFIKMLINSSIESVYLVDHYSKNISLVSACKALDIEVVEFQHGIISKYHLGYSVKNKDYDWPCYPDLFLAWGEHWLNSVELPRSVKVNYITPTYLSERVKVKKKKQLLVVSQSVIGKEIANFVIQHLDMEAFDEVIFKLHPSELDISSYYKGIFKNTKIMVSASNIYPLLNESESILGVFSTVMLEAIDFGCKVFYIDLPGAEYIQSNIAISDVKKEEFYVN